MDLSLPNRPEVGRKPSSAESQLALPLPDLSPLWFKSIPGILGKLKIDFFFFFHICSLGILDHSCNVVIGIHDRILEYLSEQIGRWNPLVRFEEILALLLRPYFKSLLH